MSNREHAVLVAARKYADACGRLTAFVATSGEIAPSEKWSHDFRAQMDAHMQEVEEVRDRLLRIAQKL